MGSNSGVRFTKNDLERTLTLYVESLPEATQAGAEAAMDAGAQAMVERLDAAVTKTGQLEHPAHPGRRVTSTLADSILDSKFGEASGSVYRINANRAGNINYTFGFLTPDDPSYLVYQEKGTNTIPPMMALQAGINVVFSRLLNDIAVQLDAAGRAAEAGRLYSRARRARL